MNLNLAKLIRATTTLAVLTTAGCSRQSEQVKACEASLLPTLKAPSTYKLIDSTLGSQNKDGIQDVFLTYDAANTYNAPIRATFWCVYDPESGRADQHDDSDVQADNMEAIAATLDAPEPEIASPSATEPPVAKAPVTPKASEDEVPVCDRPDSPEKFELMNEIGVDCTGE